MARINVSVINKLKESYIKLINKKYRDEIRITDDNIYEQKNVIRKQICNDVVEYIKGKYPNATITSVSSNYCNELRIGMDVSSTEINELDVKVKDMKKTSEEKLNELDLWEIEALKAGIEENIPVFEV